MLRCAVFAALLCCACPLLTSADDAGPGPKAKAPRPSGALVDRRRAKLVIESVDFDREVTLILPKAMKPSESGVVGFTDASIGPNQTIVIGLALSLALISGGLWLVRSRRSSGARAATAAVVATAVVAGAGGYALGNYSPYADADAKPGTLRKVRPHDGPVSGEVRVLYLGEPGEVRIVVPQKVYQEE